MIKKTFMTYDLIENYDTLQHQEKLVKELREKYSKIVITYNGLTPFTRLQDKFSLNLKCIY